MSGLRENIQLTAICARLTAQNLIRSPEAFKKYGITYAALGTYGLYSRDPTLFSVYLWFRHVDDIVDGDKPWPEDVVGYAHEKQQVIERMWQGERILHEPEDVLLHYAVQRMKSRGIDTYEEMQEVMDSMIFDAERRQNGLQPTRQQLEDNFMKMDSGVTRATLKIMGQNPNPAGLNWINEAVRREYCLNDLAEDLRVGIINIPEEYGDVPALLRPSIAVPVVRNYITDLVVQGRELALQGLQLIRQQALPFYARIPINYVGNRALQTFDRYAALLQ